MAAAAVVGRPAFGVERDAGDIDGRGAHLTAAIDRLLGTGDFVAQGCRALRARRSSAG
jgi:hypothetical protein